MMSILRGLFSKSGVSIFGLILIAVTIWFFGPYIGFGSIRPLESILARVIFIVLIFLGWGIYKFIKRRAAAKADEQLAGDLVGSPGQAGDGAEGQSEEEVALLKQRFEEAIATLRTSSKSKSNVSLYELPWFVIIGPPGSGKTTALVNSGLEFPLEQRFGKEALRGVGGTRNCDWWFTNEAVLLDTAGRYVTQDSHEKVDRAAWEGFLDLLKKYRKRRPINGVMVAISLSDLMLQSEAERNAQVLAIRHRIHELYQHFGIRFPVYMLFTKCDLVAGFIEFFDDLDQEGRQQVWGTTFPWTDGSKAAQSDTNKFRDELNLLLQRISDRMTWRLSQERDQHRRAKIYNFPQQVIALAGTLDTFLRDVFSSSRYEDQIMVRGVYFTSGTQEGTPIDRMMSVMARTFGVAEQVLPSFGGKGRSYFITDLFRKIIFQESGLAGVNPRVEKRRRWIQAAAYIGSIVLALLASFAWITSFTSNRGYLEEVDQGLEQYQTLAGSSASERATLEQVLPRLDALRSLVDVAGQYNDSVPLHMRMWLFQGKAMSESVEDAYRRELNASLGPTVMSILESRIRENTANPQLLYEYLKAYMMLGNPERLDARQLSFLIAAEWRRSYAAEGDMYTRLKQHTDFLFDQVQPFPVNQRLIAGAQATLAQSPLSEFLYSRLKLDALAYEKDDLVLSDKLGLGLDRVFRRKSGEPLSEPISVLYTRKGFTELYPVMSVQLIAEAGKENWVLGRDEAGLSVREIANIGAQLRDKYTQDYIATWQRLVMDLEIVPFNSEAQAMQTLDLIAAKPSVMRQMLDVIADNTNLSKADPEKDEAKPDEGGGESSSRLTRIFGAEAPAVSLPGGANPGDVVTKEFANLNRLVEGQPAAVDQILLMVDDLQREVEATRSGASDALRVISSGGGPAARRIRTEARRQPEPVKSWLGALGGGTEVLAAGNARTELASRYTDAVRSECQRLIANRYPFERNSRQDVAIDDFGRMFGYGGVLDKFFQENLAPVVDRSGSTWRIRGGSALGISSSSLKQFQMAERIREAYFKSGSMTPEFSLTMTTTRLDPSVKRFVFEADGQSFDYQHGPPRSSTITWPGQGAGMARIMFEEASGGRPTVVVEGPWALFRLFDGANIKPVSDIEYEIGFTAGGKSATVRAQARSVTNPLSGPGLHEFRCPDSL
jgi:type VI secretion system protein ImpL